MTKIFKNPTDLANSMKPKISSKNIQNVDGSWDFIPGETFEQLKERIGHTPTDDDIRSLFKNRKEGLNFINDNFPEGHENRENALNRLNQIYPRDVKGSSFEYTNRINKEYEDLIPFLKEKGYDVDSFTDKNIENHIRQLFDRWHEDEQKKWGGRGPLKESNAYWDSDYKPTFDALMTALDKFYNDDWRKRAPMGYVDD